MIRPARMADRLLANPAALALVGLAVAAAWILIFRFLDLYRMRGGGLAEALAVCRGNAVGALLAITVGFLMHLDISRITTALTYPLSVGCVLTIRKLLRFAIRHVYARKEVSVPLVIVGLNRVGRYLCDQVIDDLSHYELVGFVDDAPDTASYRGLPLLGPPRCLTPAGAGVSVPRSDYRAARGGRRQPGPAGAVMRESAVALEYRAVAVRFDGLGVAAGFDRGDAAGGTARIQYRGTQLPAQARFRC